MVHDYNLPIITITQKTLESLCRRTARLVLCEIDERDAQPYDIEGRTKEIVANLVEDLADGWIEEPDDKDVPPGAERQCPAIRPTGSTMERCAESRDHDGRHVRRS